MDDKELQHGLQFINNGPSIQVELCLSVVDQHSKS